jgi:hypothetical protein
VGKNGVGFLGLAGWIPVQELSVKVGVLAAMSSQNAIVTGSYDSLNCLLWK